MKIPEIITELERIIEATAQREKAIADNIAKAEAEKAAAMEAAERAYKAMDADAYHKAQDAARAADDKIKMYQAAAERERGTASITPEKYESTKAEILVELDALRAAALAQIDAQRAEIAKIARAALPLADDGNKALHLLNLAAFTADERGKRIEDRYSGMDFMKDLAREAPAEK